MLLALVGYRTDDFDKVHQDLVARKLSVMNVPAAEGEVLRARAESEDEGEGERLMILLDNHGNNIYIRSETLFEAESAVGYVFL
jgi:hypothetical protein